MAYSTPAMVRMALVPSSDGTVPNPLSFTAADLSDAQLTDAIAEADAVIDGYLSKFYQTPVALAGSPAAVPHPIDYWSRTMAAYLASCSYRMSLDFTDNDPVYRRYLQVMELLKAVAKGDYSLPLPGTGADGNEGSGSAGPPINPYEGTLFPVSDFDVQGEVWPSGTRSTSPYWH